MRVPARYILFLFTFVFLNIPGAYAQTPSFGFPAACQPGKTCWIVNYVDAEPGKDKAADFTCGSLTYDSHNGTDIAIPDLVTMEMGVDVRAAAAGKVLRLRDGEEDKMATKAERQALLAADKGCGNGVFIDHGHGWQTIYCHMKKDSIIVKPGQQVKQGDKLGQVGMSGAAEFPHVHFGVFHDGLIVDPFTGPGKTQSCGQKTGPLWDPALHLDYDPVIIAATGFHSAVPDLDALKIDSGSPDTMAADSAALVYWVMLYGVRAGDDITVEVDGPDGVLASREIHQEGNKARQFYYIGKKRTDTSWPAGPYTGRATLKRTLTDGQTLTRENEKHLKIK